MHKRFSIIIGVMQHEHMNICEKGLIYAEYISRCIITCVICIYRYGMSSYLAAADQSADSGNN